MKGTIIATAISLACVLVTGTVLATLLGPANAQDVKCAEAVVQFDDWEYTYYCEQECSCTLLACGTCTDYMGRDGGLVEIYCFGSGGSEPDYTACYRC